jgi:hypothetical protein
MSRRGGNRRNQRKRIGNWSGGGDVRQRPHELVELAGISGIHYLGTEYRARIIYPYIHERKYEFLS